MKLHCLPLRSIQSSITSTEPSVEQSSITISSTFGYVWPCMASRHSVTNGAWVKQFARTVTRGARSDIEPSNRVDDEVQLVIVEMGTDGQAEHLAVDRLGDRQGSRCPAERSERGLQVRGSLIVD